MHANWTSISCLARLCKQIACFSNPTEVRPGWVTGAFRVPRFRYILEKGTPKLTRMWLTNLKYNAHPPEQVEYHIDLEIRTSLF